MIRGVDERQLAVGRMYARSLLTLADERGEADPLGEELAGLVTLLDGSPALERFLSDPLVDADDRRQALERSLRGRASDLLVDGLLVINRKGRLALLRAVAEAYRQELELLRGEVDVEVTTAVPLSDAQRAEIAAVAGERTGKKPRLVEQVDEDLLGGMVLRIGDQKFDTSVAKELHQLGARLVERASTEIQGGRRFYAEADGEQGV